MKKAILTLTILILASIACQLPGTTLGTQAGTLTAPAAPHLITGSPGPTEENPAGAVYWPATPEPARLCAIVTAIKAVHLRTGPSEKAEHIQYLTNGGQVRVLNPAGRWWKIQTSTGITGYANSRYLQEAKCQD